MTENPEDVSEAIKKLKIDTSELSAAALALMKNHLAEFQEGLKRTEELARQGAGELSEDAEAAREQPLTAMMKAAGAGFLVGWLIRNGKFFTTEEAEEMGHHEGEQETVRQLRQKIETMQADIAALTNAAGEELQNMAETLRMKYESTSKAARDYVTENPVKTSLAAGIAGVALGFLLHTIWRQHEGRTH